MSKKSLISFLNEEDFVGFIQKKQEQFQKNNKTILFIEPYGAVVSLLKRGLETGFNIIIFTACSDLRIVPLKLIDSVQLAIEVDTADQNQVLKLAQLLSRHMQIDAVIPGFEYFVPIAAYVSRELNNFGISLEHVMALRRKDLMRVALEKARLIQPNFCIVKSLYELDEAIKKIGFPAVCKPIDAAGSVNVRKVNNRLEAVLAAIRILEGQDILWGHSLSRVLLFEEYVEGKEFSLEGVVQNGRVIHFSMTEKFVSDQLEFIEIGHIVNVPMQQALKNKIEKYVEDVISVLHIDHCPFHAEIRVTAKGQPILMEIAARLAGDKIGDLINLSTSINYFDYVFAAYLGEILSPQKINHDYAGIRFFYRPEIESYSEVSGILEAKQLSIEEICLYYSKDQKIPSFPKPLRRLGHVIAKSHEYRDLLKILSEVDKNIVFYP